MPDLTPDQLASARADWIALGHDAAAFDAAMAGAGPTAAGPGSEPDIPASDIEAAKLHSQREARELVAGLRASGVDDARIRAALADGRSEAEIDAILAVAPDTRSDDVKALDAAGVKPGNPADYSIRWVDRMPAGMDVAQLAQADAGWRTFLATIGAPALSGASVAEEMLDAGQAYARMAEPAQALYKLEQRALFNRLSGGEEQAAACLATVQGLLAKADKGFVDALHASGALHSANVITYLADIGRLSGVRAAVQGGQSLGRATA